MIMTRVSRNDTRTDGVPAYMLASTQRAAYAVFLPTATRLRWRSSA